jgi:nicotinic acid mononucleotide adenylyltransferase
MKLVFGLSGNPPHRGHLDVIRQGLEKYRESITEVIIVPCKKHPFNKTLNEFHIIEQLNIAFAADVSSILNTNAQMRDIEGYIMGDTGQDVVYSANVVDYLKLETDEDILLCYGPDNKANFDKFYLRERLIKLTTLFFAEQKVDIRSTYIRDAFIKGDNIDQYITPSVKKVIENFGRDIFKMDKTA